MAHSALFRALFVVVSAGSAGLQEGIRWVVFAAHFAGCEIGGVEEGAVYAIPGLSFITKLSLD